MYEDLRVKMRTKRTDCRQINVLCREGLQNLEYEELGQGWRNRFLAGTLAHTGTKLLGQTFTGQ